MCPNVCHGRYCAKHRHLEKDERLPSHKRGYDKQWQKARKAYASEHPFCEDPYGLHDDPPPVAIVDHIVPISDGGPRLDARNFQSLCWSCHEKKKAQERGLNIR